MVCSGLCQCVDVLRDGAHIRDNGLSKVEVIDENAPTAVAESLETPRLLFINDACCCQHVRERALQVVMPSPKHPFIPACQQMVRTKAREWLVVEHTHGPVGILFWSGRRSHRRRFIRISVVGRNSFGSEGSTNRNAEAPGLDCESSWSCSRVGINFRVEFTPCQVNLERNYLFDVVTFSSLLRGWWQKWGNHFFSFNEDEVASMVTR